MMVIKHDSAKFAQLDHTWSTVAILVAEMTNFSPTLFHGEVDKTFQPSADAGLMDWRKLASILLPCMEDLDRNILYMAWPICAEKEGLWIFAKIYNMVPAWTDVLCTLINAYVEFWT